MQNARIGRSLQFGILLLLVATYLTSQAQNNFEWMDASRKTRNLSDLEEILGEHQQWVDSRRTSGTRADLSGAHLMGANLSEANLSEANLSGANLSAARLSDADLRDADLNGADLSLADLMDAHLSGANLSGAYLFGAGLRGATLVGANLMGADLFGADLSRALFEPKSLPELHGIAGAKNLELLTYYTNPDALVQVRKQFEDGGFRKQERKITYALKRREAELTCDECTRMLLTDCVSFVFKTVFFDWTCQYGMSPGRPLVLGCLLWLLCSLLYFGIIHRSGRSGHSGLYRVYGKGVRDAPSAPQRVKRILPLKTRQTLRSRRRSQFLWRECLLLRTSMFFSLMSAFNIGFRDINFGRWLRLLTRQEFDIKAVGWARVVAGWQSLISVYLIALWVLTYFGRPFE